MGQVVRQKLSGREGGRQTLYVVVPYARRAAGTDIRGKWQIGRHMPFPELGRAQSYARNCLGRGEVVGAIVARQSVDMDAGDYADPEIISRFGELPDLADPIASV